MNESAFLRVGSVAVKLLVPSAMATHVHVKKLEMDESRDGMLQCHLHADMCVCVCVHITCMHHITDFVNVCMY